MIDKNDELASATIFHSNCRGISVAILNDEKDPPAIGGVPKAVRDRFGDAVNALVQPKTPITKKGTPARAEAHKRQERAQ